MIAIDKSEGFSARSPKQLSMRMAEYFGDSYLSYYANHLDVSNGELLMRQFIKSQNNIFEYIKKEIVRKVITANYLGDIRKSIWFATKLIQQARLEIISPMYDIKGNYIRRQIEKSLQEQVENFAISFQGLKDPRSRLNEDFKLELQQKKILEVDFRLWGLSKTLQDKGIFKKLKPAYINQHVIDDADGLKAIINFLSGGKARVYILHDTGDLNLGYQYLVPQRNTEGEIYKEAFKHFEWIPKGPDYFDIDLTVDGSQDGLILEYLMHVVLGTTELIVIKKPGAAWDDGEMICAFNQYRFLKPHEIHSGTTDGNLYDSRKYDNFQVVITKQSATFDVSGWLNHMGLTRGSTGEFAAYMNSIFEDPDNYLLNFLERYRKYSH